jgi:hypothetical protein
MNESVGHTDGIKKGRGGQNLPVFVCTSIVVYNLQGYVDEHCLLRLPGQRLPGITGIGGGSDKECRDGALVSVTSRQELLGDPRPSFTPPRFRTLTSSLSSQQQPDLHILILILIHISTYVLFINDHHSSKP